MGPRLVGIPIPACSLIHGCHLQTQKDSKTWGRLQLLCTWLSVSLGVGMSLVVMAGSRCARFQLTGFIESGGGWKEHVVSGRAEVCNLVIYM